MVKITNEVAQGSNILNGKNTQVIKKAKSSVSSSMAFEKEAK